MKRAALVFDIIIIIVLLASCSVNRTLNSGTKKIAGNWQLQTVVSEGITGTASIQQFNEADFQCFIGSNWKLGKDNTGSYSISEASGAIPCTAANRNIRWMLFASADGERLFRFKRLDSAGKDVDPNTSGNILSVVNLTADSMQLRSDITYNNKPAALIFKFIKM